MTQVQQWFAKNKQFLVVIVILFAVRWSFADHYRVPSESMMPTIEIGDHIAVNKTAYSIKVPFSNIEVFRTGEVERGDIIVFIPPHDPSTNYVKRVVGLPGDSVLVDGEYRVVPKDKYYVLGDNRSASLDSRYWGFVDREQIKGRASHVLFSAKLDQGLPVLQWRRTLSRLADFQ